MKRISEREAREILEVSAEARTNYPPAALEKDLHLTFILRELANISQTQNGLVLAGGTSLVKGYRLFDRMSEDLDFKLDQKDIYTTSQLRVQLSKFRFSLIKLFESLDFEVMTSHSNNENRFFTIDLAYERAFESISSLRPTIKLEFFSSKSIARSELKPITSLLCASLDSAEEAFDFPCAAPSQTATEKLIGFLNRFYSDHYPRDERLIRHIHDIYYIINGGTTIEEIALLFPAIFQEELDRFGHTSKNIGPDRVNHLINSLKNFESDHELNDTYEKFISELTVGNGIAFSQAKQLFINLAGACIQQLSNAN
jgi:predicted nucleotidyltransferase component of viral defense system